MKALILSAGIGERLRPLSNLYAKPAIPFLNKPLINQIIENLAEYKVKEIAINLHHLPETIIKAVSEFKNLKIVFSHEKKLLGTAGAIKKLEYFFKEEKHFLVLNGDTLQKIPINSMINYHLRENSFATFLVRKKQKNQKYSSLIVDREGNLIGFKKNEKGKNQLMYCGAVIFSSEILKFIPPDERMDLFIDIFPRLKESKKRMKVFHYNGPWKEIGTPRSYLEYSLRAIARGENLIDKNVNIHSSAKIENSIIGKDSKIYEGVSIRSSIIWENSKIDTFSIIENSIIASDVILPPYSLIKNKIVYMVNKKIKSVEIK